MASGIPFNPHLTTRASVGVGMCPISGDPAQDVPDWELGQEAGNAKCRRSGRRPHGQAKAKSDKSEEGIKSNRLEEKMN